ncbi:MAG: transglutaminase family protein, partial [Flavihumibacter sp.]
GCHWQASSPLKERIEMLIHRLHYCDLVKEFTRWIQVEEPELLAGALLVAKFHYPDLQVNQVLQDLEKMRRNIWLELNNYLTPLEQTNVLTTILYNYYHLKGTEVNYKEPNDFLLNNVLESKKGNALCNGILYLVLCDLLSIPIRAISIPKQHILAYYDLNGGDWADLPANPLSRISFFIDPTNGQVYSQKDVETYFRRISVPLTGHFFRPVSTRRQIQLLLEEFACCFDNDRHQYKRHELLELAAMLDE